MRRLLKQEVEEYVDKLREKVVQEDNKTIIGGNLEVDGTIVSNTKIESVLITGDEIIEKMEGYAFLKLSEASWTPIYVGAVKTGNKLTIVVSGTLNRGADGQGNPNLCYITINSNVMSKLYPWVDNVLEQKIIYFQKDAFNQTPIQIRTVKEGTSLRYEIFNIQTLDASTDYYFRLEQTFLLSNSLAV